MIFVVFTTAAQHYNAASNIKAAQLYTVEFKTSGKKKMLTITKEHNKNSLFSRDGER